MRKVITDQQKKFAVARILAGKSTSQREAGLLGVTPQAVRAWVRELRPPPPPEPVRTETSPDSVPPSTPEASPSGAGAAVTDSDPLARARAAAGISGAAPDTSLPPPEVLRAAEEADRQLVVQTAIDAKRGVLQFVGTKAGLKPDDQALEKISGLTPLLATALQANASWIAPIIREKLQGKFALIVAVALDGLMTIAALREILKARGLVKDKENPKPEPPPPVAEKKPEVPA